MQASALIIGQRGRDVKEIAACLPLWTVRIWCASIGYMEISLTGSNSLKIRGKHAAVYVNPQDKTANYNAAILLGNPAKSLLKIRDDVVIIDGPGEYEAGGIKITGIWSDNQTVYTISIDNLEVLLGDREALEKVYQKLKEHQIAIVYSGSPGGAAFATSLATKALIFTGEHAREVVDSLAKEEKKELTKYVVTAEKLPVETETILLASS